MDAYKHSKSSVFLLSLISLHHPELETNSLPKIFWDPEYILPLPVRNFQQRFCNQVPSLWLSYGIADKN